MEKKSCRDLTQGLRDGAAPSADPSALHWRFIRNGLTEWWLSGSHSLRKEKERKDWNYTKLHKIWTENQHVLMSNESKFENFGSSNQYVYTEDSQNRDTTVSVYTSIRHGGGSVMVGGCIFSQWCWGSIFFYRC